jgi:hypothetical protein
MVHARVQRLCLPAGIQRKDFDWQWARDVLLVRDDLLEPAAPLWPASLVMERDELARVARSVQGAKTLARDVKAPVLLRSAVASHCPGLDDSPDSACSRDLAALQDSDDCRDSVAHQAVPNCRHIPVYSDSAVAEAYK